MRPRTRLLVILASTSLLVASCGGGGGGGGSGRGSGERFVSGGARAVGWIGGEQEGWQTGNAPSEGAAGTSFDGPRDVFVDEAGTIYVVDGDNRRVCKWDSTGRLLGWIGRGLEGWQTGDVPPRWNERHVFASDVFVLDDGTMFVSGKRGIAKWSAAGKLLGRIEEGWPGWQTGSETLIGDRRYAVQPAAICVDAEGTIYAADANRPRIVKLTGDGEVVGWLGGSDDGWRTDLIPLEGHRVTQFTSPQGVAVDGEGSIYVSDWTLSRLSKWTRDGVCLGWVGFGIEGWQTSHRSSWNAKRGQSEAHPRRPRGLAIGPEGFLYVAEWGNDRISKWDPDGRAIGWIGGGRTGWQRGEGPEGGSGLGWLREPRDVTVTADGTIYVTDSDNHRVAIWDRDGRPLGWIGGGADGIHASDAPAWAEDMRSFRSPLGVGVDATGKIHVAEERRVSRWTADGIAEGWIGGGEDGWMTGLTPTGSRADDIWPRSIWVDGEGFLYVGEGDRVSKWSPEGVAIGWIGGGKDGWRTESAVGAYGHGDREIAIAAGVCVDDAGMIYVAEDTNARVSRWERDGVYRGWIGGGKDGWRKGSAPGEGKRADSFSSPADIAVRGDMLYIVDSWLHRVSRWTTDGRARGWIGGGVSGWRMDKAKDHWVWTGKCEGHRVMEDGRSRRKFKRPHGIWVTGEHVFVGDSSNARVVRWPIDGGDSSSLPVWFGHGSDGWQGGTCPKEGDVGLRHMKQPRGVAVDADGNVLVVEEENHCVSRWAEGE